MADAANQNELYSEEFDVDGVLSALRNSAILKASRLHSCSSYKLLFKLEGGQRAMFKPKFQ